MPLSLHVNLSPDWLTEWPTDWLTDLLTDWLTDRPTDWLTYWLTDWPTDWLTDWPTDWPTYWLTYWLTDLLTDWPTDLLTDWLADWLTPAPSFTRCILQALSWHEMQFLCNIKFLIWVRTYWTFVWLPTVHIYICWFSALLQGKRECKFDSVRNLRISEILTNFPAVNM